MTMMVRVYMYCITICPLKVEFELMIRTALGATTVLSIVNLGFGGKAKPKVSEIMMLILVMLIILMLMLIIVMLTMVLIQMISLPSSSLLIFLHYPS